MNFEQLRLTAYDPVAGTESLYDLLKALVGFVRPASILEVGAGLSTISILEGLHIVNKTDVKKNIYYRESYNNPTPHLVSVDNGYQPELLIQFRLFDNITPVVDDFKNLTFKKDQFDFVFFDCGGYEEYKYFVENYWEYIQVGATVVFHYTWVYDREQDVIKESTFVKQLRKNRGVEFAGLVEPHKISQGSITILKKVSNDKIILED